MRNAMEPIEFDVPIGARQLRVVRYGDGPVNVVFEAGGGRGSGDWLAVQRLLPEVTSWSYDRAGEGASPSNGDWSLHASIHDLQAWMDAADVGQPAFFVGHSLGCHIIRAYVAAHPNAASAMLLVDARPPHFERTVLRAGIAIPTPPPDASIVKEITLADDIVCGLQVPVTVTAVAICSDRFDGAPGELTDTAADKVVRLWREAQADVALSVGQASMMIVPGTGHGVPTEAPGYVASVIRDVIDRQRAAGRRD